MLAAALLAGARPSVAVRSTRFYDVLGVSPDADERTIKKAYKRQVRHLTASASVAPCCTAGRIRMLLLWERA